MKTVFYFLFFSFFLLFSCSEEKEHTAPAIYPSDSVSVMTTYGVNTLISDSGVIRYRIVSEEWEVNQVRTPSKWIFEKGLFLECFDDKFQVESYIQCDTAYYYDQKRLWELRGRVNIRTNDGLVFTSEELFWDQMNHELYSFHYSRLITPERRLEGAYFRSDEKMRNYLVSNTKGAFNSGDFMDEKEDENTHLVEDSLPANSRSPIVPQKRNTTIPLVYDQVR